MAVAVGAAPAAAASRPPSAKKEDDTDDVAVANYALTLEHLQHAFYRDGLEEFSDEEIRNADNLSVFGEQVRSEVPKRLNTTSPFPAAFDGAKSMGEVKEIAGQFIKGM